MSLWYDPDTDTVIQDTNPGDEPPPKNEDWRELGGKGTYDPYFPESTPATAPPDLTSESPKSKGPATRYDEIVLGQLAKAGFSGKDLADAGIRVTHHLGAEQGLTAKELLDTLAEMSDDEIRNMVDKAVLDLTTRDPKGNLGFDFARDYMQELYAPRPDSSNLYGLPEKPPSASGLSPAAPIPSSFADIRHDPDLQNYYLSALNVYHNALGRGLTDAERQKLADTITRGGLWKELDELREKQLKNAAERFSLSSPDYSQAEDYALRHPEYSPVPPLLKSGYQVYDSSAGGLAQAGRPPLSQAIDMIKAHKGSAKDAAQYVIDQTYGTPVHVFDDPLGRYFSSNFGGLGGIAGDSDFQSQFQDNHYYNEWWGGQPIESKQFGHFWTAVDMGINGSPDYKSQMIKHEQIPDSQPWRMLEELRLRASPEDMSAFDWAVVFDMQGDNASRDAMLMSILDSSKYGDLKNRQGNSLEDLRLSVRGWELGRDIALGAIKTNEELADWIERNIARGN